MSTSTVDFEKNEGAKEYQVGFADFAEYVASDSDLSLYKGFHSIAARNLLYLQAELQVLSNQLTQMDEEDKQHMARTRDEEKKAAIDKAARAWEGIQEQCEEMNERERQRMGLILKIRKLVKEYGKCLSTKDDSY